VLKAYQIRVWHKNRVRSGNHLPLYLEVIDKWLEPLCPGHFRVLQRLKVRGTDGKGGVVVTKSTGLLVPSVCSLRQGLQGYEIHHIPYQNRLTRMISTQLIMDRTLAMMMVCSPVVSLALCLRYRGSNPLLCQKLYNC